ncbi:hypothetical protein, partial [Pseudomonas carnis]
YCLNSNCLPDASPAVEVERFYRLKRFSQRVSEVGKNPTICLKSPDIRALQDMAECHYLLSTGRPGIKNQIIF